MHDPASVFDRYENFKKSFQSTEQQCNAAGFGFHPFVFEAHAGGWSPLGRKICSHIAKNAAVIENTTVEAASLRIAQRLSAALHRENARAILKRQALAQAPPYQGEWWEHTCEQWQ